MCAGREAEHLEVHTAVSRGPWDTVGLAKLL